MTVKLKSKRVCQTCKFFQIIDTAVSCIVNRLLLMWWHKEPGHQQTWYWTIPCAFLFSLTQWSLTHQDLSDVCFYQPANQAIISSTKGLSSVLSQAIFWTIISLLSIVTLGTNFSVIRSKIQQFLFKKMNLKMSAKQWPFCLNLYQALHIDGLV